MTIKCTMTLKCIIVIFYDATTLRKEHEHLEYVKKHETTLDE